MSQKIVSPSNPHAHHLNTANLNGIKRLVQKNQLAKPYVLTGDFEDDTFLLHQVTYVAVVYPFNTIKDRTSGKRVPLDLCGKTIRMEGFDLHFNRRRYDGWIRASVKSPGLVPVELRRLLRTYGKVVISPILIEVKCFLSSPPTDPRRLFPGGKVPRKPPNRDNLIEHWAWETKEFLMRCYELSLPSYAFGPMVEVIWKCHDENSHFDEFVRSAIKVLNTIRGEAKPKLISTVQNKIGKRPSGRPLDHRYTRQSDLAAVARKGALEILKSSGRIANTELAALHAYAGEARWARARDFAVRSRLKHTKDEDGNVVWFLPTP